MTESEKQSLTDKIERLQHDKQQLALELQRYENEQRAFDIQTRGLKERFQNTEQRHQNFASLLTQALVKRGLAMNVVPELEAHARKRRGPKIGFLYNGAGSEDSPIGSSESLSGENIDGNSASSITLDQVEQLDASLTFWEEIVHDFSNSRLQISSDLELDGSRGCAETPGISNVQLNTDIRSKSPGIDVNSEPATVAADAAALKEQSSKEQANGLATVPTGVNDVFWEQFLTENPGSSDAREVQSERKDSESRNESNLGDRGKFWWSSRNVNNLTEQMGHLTPAEKT